MSTPLQQINKKIAQSGPSKSKVTELNLQGIKIVKFTKQITKTLEQCAGLELLILSSCNLESLQGLPKVDIQGLDLSQNELTDKDVKCLKIYPRLNQLLLTDNKIEKVDSLKALQSCPDLQEVDISNNPVASDANYRTTMFDMLKNLSCLDGKDVDGNDIQEQQSFEQGSDEDDEQDFDDDQDEDSEDNEQDEQQSEQVKPTKKRK